MTKEEPLLNAFLIRKIRKMRNVTYINSKNRKLSAEYYAIREVISIVFYIPRSSAE